VILKKSPTYVFKFRLIPLDGRTVIGFVPVRTMDSVAVWKVIKNTTTPQILTESNLIRIVIK
jgi:hypothetical protein